MKLLICVLIVSAASAQTCVPNVTNSRFESRTFSGNLASDLHAASATWFGYAIKATPGDRKSCCWDDSNQCGCHLEESRSNVTVMSHANVPVHLEELDQMAILFRVASSGIGKLRVYSASCPLDAGGLPFVWLTGVPGNVSVAFLQKLLAASASDHIVDGAVFAIAQHDGRQADNVLDQLAHPPYPERIREKAIFWLAQKAGTRAVSTITGVIENDPDTSVKKQAVFALSQLPNDQAVPMLIEIARTQRNREVRKQAFFWLGQSKDPRALAFFEEILTR